MSYYPNTIGRWWEYVYPFFGIAMIVNVVLIIVVSENPGGIIGAIQHVLAEPRQGTELLVLFLAVGPLFNAYVSIVSAKSAIEADDDYFHFNDEFDMPNLPSSAERTRLVFALSVVSGLLFLPFTFWLYTAPIGLLWGLDAPLLMQPGLFLSIFLVLFAFLVVPRIFPSAAKHLADLEEIATDKFTDLSDKYK